MHSHEQVYRFLKDNRDNGYCDDCLAAATGVEAGEVTMTTTTMRLFPLEFSRSQSRCPQCSRDGKLVTFAI
jgi:hypothetical protein